MTDASKTLRAEAERCVALTATAIRLGDTVNALEEATRAVSLLVALDTLSHPPTGAPTGAAPRPHVISRRSKGGA